jgi:hypothetical protein
MFMKRQSIYFCIMVMQSNFCEKFRSSTNSWTTCFHGKSFNVLILTKKMVGLHFVAFFFTNALGHSADTPDSALMSLLAGPGLKTELGETPVGGSVHLVKVRFFFFFFFYGPPQVPRSGWASKMGPCPPVLY